MWSKCLQKLKEGKWEEGWPDHEWIRTGDPQFKDKFETTPTYGKPIWRGEKEPISLLVNADFGMGDTIHFYRFLAEAATKVQKLSLRCDEDFRGLFDFDMTQNTDCDKICHMMTLPKILGSAISGKPYLQPKGQPHGLTKMQFEKPKVGFCWCGNPFNPRDSDRSIPLDIFMQMIVGVVPYTLVKHCEPPEGFLDVRGLMGDWNQTAHLLKSLDLIVSVDTAIAHLGGALGVPTWLLLPDNPDWRWGTSGESTAWYDSVRIFRQSKDWTSLIEPIRQNLLDLKLSNSRSLLASGL